MPKKLAPEIAKRMYENMYICMRCNAKLRTSRQKVLRHEAKCRKCSSKNLRLKAKERRGQKGGGAAK